MSSPEIPRVRTSTFTGQIDVPAQSLPTTETLILSGDVEIISISIANKGGQANPKFSIKDNQATPEPFVFGLNTPVSVGSCAFFGPGPGKLAKGGLRWVQDTADALSGSIEYRRP